MARQSDAPVRSKPSGSKVWPAHRVVRTVTRIADDAARLAERRAVEDPNFESDLGDFADFIGDARAAD